MKGAGKKPGNTQKEKLESLRLEVDDLKAKTEQLHEMVRLHVETPDSHISKSIIYWSFGTVLALVIVLWLLPLR